MAKEFVVKHSMLGVINPETGDPYKAGDTVPAEHLGEKANQDRLLKLGAVGEAGAADDKRSEVAGSPEEAERLSVEQSRQVDLDPAASPLADNQDSTNQAINADQNKANNKK
jgi:hypothetical protein